MVQYRHYLFAQLGPMEGEMQFETTVEVLWWQFIIAVLIVTMVTIGISWLVRALPIRRVVVDRQIIITLKVPISFERGNLVHFVLPVCLSFETGAVIRRGAPLPLDDAPELAEQLCNLLKPIATQGFMFSNLIVSSIRRVGNQVEVVVAYSPAGSSTRILPDEFVTHFEKWCVPGTGWQMQGSLPPLEPSVDHNKCDAVESGSPVIA